MSIKNLEARIAELEAALSGMSKNMLDASKTSKKQQVRLLKQKQSIYGIYPALCVDTIDIYKQNRIRYFSPQLHDPNSSYKSLPFAYPISTMGGFDDSGLNWVPPAGSTVMLMFEAGNRSAGYYLGTTWSRDRGADGRPKFPIPIPEYENIYKDKRDGYLCGPNDGSQVLPPWNTESYNGFDITSVQDLETSPAAAKRITYPNIYGFKTPEKHMVKMVDGDAKCNRKWKRLEIMSGNGNWMIFKDDHLHYAGQWAHPDCGSKKGDVSCVPGVPNPEPRSVEDVTLLRNRANVNIDEETVDLFLFDTNRKVEQPPGSTVCGGVTIGGNSDYPGKNSQVGANPFFKHMNECRPYKGPQTPQNNKCDLPQSGIQLLSISGHSFVMDDSVKDPQGGMEWSRSTKPFDFGCTDMYLGRTYWKSATGHTIEMNDAEKGGTTQKVRGIKNGIKLKSALGNEIFLCDDSEGPKCPSPATQNQGILIRSASNNIIQLSDGGNKRDIPCRREGGVPQSKASTAYVSIRTGYGMGLDLVDMGSQEQTKNQYARLFTPQKDNKTRGPHYLLFSEAATGPGTVQLRTGGNYLLSTCDNSIEYIGYKVENKKYVDNKGSKITYVSGANYEVVGDYKYTQAKRIFCKADEDLVLLSGKDYQLPVDKEGNPTGKGPGAFPVVVFVPGKNGGGVLKISDRIYASTSPNAPTVSIYNLRPYINTRPR
jgi:hypothetical protein